MVRSSVAVILLGPRLRDADDRAAGLLDAERGLLARGRKGVLRFAAPLALAFDGVGLAFALDGVGLSPFASMGPADVIFLAGGRAGKDLAGDAFGSLDAVVFVTPGLVNLRGGGVAVENRVGARCIPGTYDIYISGIFWHY